MNVYFAAHKKKKKKKKKKRQTWLDNSMEDSWFVLVLYEVFERQLSFFNFIHAPWNNVFK